MKVSQLKKHPVLDISSATTVGQIDDVVVDPVKRQILGFTLHKAAGKENWLSWAQLKSFGADAATIETTDVLSTGPGEAAPRTLLRGKVIGGRVLTDQGLGLGSLADVEFDPGSGAVTALVLDGGHVLGGDSLRGIGTYATMVVHPGDP
jgi:uncharacterized protein YrrD